MIAEFDREKAYERHGLVGSAQWLNWQCGIGPVAAREKVRVARALEQLPEISQAFESGEISYSKVRAMTRVATPANESVLVHVARYGTAAHVEKLVRKTGAIVRKALEAAADALRLVAETFLAHRGEETGAGSSADRYQVVVHIDQAVLTDVITARETEPHRCELDDGPALALDTARRLACDATIVGFVEGVDDEPLNVGRKTRGIPPALSRALRARDGGCRFPGCDRTRFTEGHHVKHWADGGETKVGNLVTLCTYHHRLVHEGGFGLTATDDGVFVFARPDGRRVAENGECFRGNISQRRVVAGPDCGFEETLRVYTLNRDAGLNITHETRRCQWLGESMDYSTAIEAMQFLEQKALPDARPPGCDSGFRGSTLSTER